jgi:hypothetical protein
VTARRASAALALAIGLAHLPFLASWLEDIDSVNFALGVRDFDVAAHRPHPPGYPVYIAVGKVTAAVVGMVSGESPQSAIEARALSIVSLLAAVVAVFAMYRAYAALAGPGEMRTASETERTRAPRPQDTESSGAFPPGEVTTVDLMAMAATAVALTCPLLWTLAVRPLSDLPGLALALVSQVFLLTAWRWQTVPPSGDRRLTPEMTARSGRMIVLGALVAGLAVGMRTQALWLTAPMLLVVLVDRIGRGVAGAVIGATMTSAIGVLAWAIPLVAVSGGLSGYLTALGTQAGEDFGGGEMLYLNPAPRMAALALAHTFVDPWESIPLAVVVLVLAAAGLTRLLWRDRRTLVAVIALALPYAVFHLLFQDTSFTRYAAPLVPVVAFAAVHGLRLVHAAAVPAGAAVLSVWAMVIAGPVVVRYAASPAPAVLAVAVMNAEAAEVHAEALAMHQTFVRPLEAEQVDVPQLPAPPRREWLELARFWTDGHDGPLWFLADPRRTDFALVDPRSRTDITQFRWAPSTHRVLGGMRPAAADWIRFSNPRWFAETGWSLTPETAGMARLMGRGPHLEPIVARVRRSPGPMRVLVGGRNLAAPGDPAVRITLAIDERAVESWEVAPGFFLKVIDVPAGVLDGAGRFAALTIQARPVTGEVPIPTAIEQFDIQPPGTVMWGFDEGWHEAEYTPQLGVWRWTSERASLRVVDARSIVRVRLEIERPLRYFDAPSQVRALVGGREIAASTIGEDGAWSFDVDGNALREAGDEIVIETTQTFVPAERAGGPDRRRLGLRVFKVVVEEVGLR